MCGHLLVRLLVQDCKPKGGHGRESAPGGVQLFQICHAAFQKGFDAVKILFGYVCLRPDEVFHRRIAVDLRIAYEDSRNVDENHVLEMDGHLLDAKPGICRWYILANLYQVKYEYLKSPTVMYDLETQGRELFFKGTRPSAASCIRPGGLFEH